MSNLAINRLIQSFNFKGKTVALFLPIVAQKEFNTFALIEFLKRNQIKWCIPKTNLISWEMTFYTIEDLSEVSVNKFGIPEPINGFPVEPHEIDLFVTPLLAFDKKGNRIGYGKGCYDRYFALCKHRHQKIGVSIFDQPLEILERETKDIKLDFCVTPFNKYVF